MIMQVLEKEGRSDQCRQSNSSEFRLSSGRENSSTRICFTVASSIIRSIRMSKREFLCWAMEFACQGSLKLSWCCSVMSWTRSGQAFTCVFQHDSTETHFFWRSSPGVAIMCWGSKNSYQFGSDKGWFNSILWFFAAAIQLSITLVSSLLQSLISSRLDQPLQSIPPSMNFCNLWLTFLRFSLSTVSSYCVEPDYCCLPFAS